jgi:3-hydroxyisobutyrate dehydrogenase-like beta-hydroxyacid dehydrogenase
VILVLLKYMNKLTRRVLFIAIALLAGLAAGCGKKAQAPETAAPPSASTAETAAKPSAPAEAGSVSSSSLPEAKEVMAALDKKDYDTVVAGLLRAKMTATSREQQLQFSTLAEEVKIKLLEAAPSEPKATAALADLRRITGGR